MFDELRVKLCVVSNLYRAGRSKQAFQWSERFVVSEVAICKGIQVDNAHAVGRSELDQTQAGVVRIKVRGLCVEANDSVFPQMFDCFTKLFFCFDYLILCRGNYLLN